MYVNNDKSSNESWKKFLLVQRNEPMGNINQENATICRHSLLTFKEIEHDIYKNEIKAFIPNLYL